MDWDKYFMSLVYLVAMRSKDESTHIGAVIVDDKNRIVSCGYNSFPMGIDDNNPERQQKPEKYFWMEHAERNSIYSAQCSVNGCRIYVQGIPCMDCARAIVQSGIKEVIVHGLWTDRIWNEKWEESSKRTQVLFDEANVKLRFYDGELITNITGQMSGETFNINLNGKVV